jgi:hypothetical protein
MRIFSVWNNVKDSVKLGGMAVDGKLDLQESWTEVMDDSATQPLYTGCIFSSSGP